MQSPEETQRELYARLVSEAAPWLALDRKNFVAAAKSLADGDVGPHLPTKDQLRQVAEVYFAMAQEDFQQKWVSYVKQRFAQAVFDAADGEDKDTSVAFKTRVPSAWEDPHRVGVFDSALLRIRKHPGYLSSLKAQTRAVADELERAKSWTPEQGIALEPALRKTLAELAPLRGPLPPTASAVEIFGYYVRELEDFLASAVSSRTASRRRRLRSSSSDSSDSDASSTDDEYPRRSSGSARARKARLKRVRAELKVPLTLTPYEIDVRNKFLDAHEVFVTDAVATVPKEVLLHIEKEFAPQRIRFRDVYRHGKGETRRIRVRQVYAAAAAIYRIQIQRSNVIRARENDGSPADPGQDRRDVRNEEAMRSQLRIKITLLMGESEMWSNYHEELRGDADLGALELAHPDASVKVLKRIRKSMLASVQSRRERTGKRDRGSPGKPGTKKDKKNWAEPRCFYCNKVGHRYPKCPDMGKKKFHPKGRFASWKGDLPAGVKEP